MRPVERPILWCDQCGGPREHTFAREDIHGSSGLEWDQIYRCNTCQTERRWGLVNYHQRATNDEEAA